MSIRLIHRRNLMIVFTRKQFQEENSSSFQDDHVLISQVVGENIHLVIDIFKNDQQSLKDCDKYKHELNQHLPSLLNNHIESSSVFQSFWQTDS